MDKNARPEANQLDCRRMYTHTHTHTVQDTNRVAIVCDFIAPKVVYARTHTQAIYLYYIMFKHTQQSVRISDARKRAARIRFPARSDVTEVLFLFYFHLGISARVRVCVCVCVSGQKTYRDRNAILYIK